MRRRSPLVPLRQGVGLLVLLVTLLTFALKAGHLIATGWNMLGILRLRHLLLTESPEPTRTVMLTEAGDAFSRALMYAPDYSRAHTNLGNVYTLLGDSEAAIRALSEALRYAPYNRVTAFHLGQRLAEMGDEAAARVAWTRARAAPYLARQAIALRFCDPDTALLYGERAVAVDPDNIRGYVALGWVLTAVRRSPPLWLRTRPS